MRQRYHVGRGKAGGGQGLQRGLVAFHGAFTQRAGEGQNGAQARVGERVGVALLGEGDQRGVGLDGLQAGAVVGHQVGGAGQAGGVERDQQALG